MSSAVRHISPIKGPLKQRKYSIIIPAAGSGSRMITYGAKPLLNLDGKGTLINRQVSLIQEAFRNHEIILVTGFQADKVMANTPDDIVKIENENYENTNVVRSIGMGLRVATTDRVVIIYGDLVFNREALQAPMNKESMIVYDKKGTMKEEEVGCTIESDYVQQMFYELPNKWAQIAYLTGEELDIFKKVAWKRDNSMLFGFEAINQTIDRGGKFRCFSPKGMKVTDIDSSRDIRTAREIL